jgi:hypothetical protein
VLSSNSLPFRLTFLGVLCPPEVPEIDTDSDTPRLAGVENVPLEPSGNDSVCISTEEIAVVGLACNAGRCLLVVRGGRDGSEAWRWEGLGGRGGRCSGASRSSASSSASLSRSRVIASLVPFSDAAGTVGFDSVVACARSLVVEVQVEAEDIAGSGEPIRLGRRRVRLPGFAGTCVGTVYYAQKVINVVDGWMWMGIGSWANRVVVLAGAPSIGQPRLAHLVCRVRLQRTRLQAANCA